ncbi:hypothetical protein AB0P32_01095 [Streptomyces sp. NPDC085995]
MARDHRARARRGLPDALACRKDHAPEPGGSDTPAPRAAALDPHRRQYI